MGQATLVVLLFSRSNVAFNLSPVTACKNTSIKILYIATNAQVNIIVGGVKLLPGEVIIIN